MKRPPKKAFEDSLSDYQDRQDTKQPDTKKVVVAVVIGFFIGFGSAWLWLNRPTTSSGLVVDIDEAAETKDNNGFDEAVEESGDVFVEDNIVLVKDQSAGGSVFVSRVEVESSGWVAIHEDAGGQMGNVLGARRFDPGVHQGTVELLRGTEKGKMYYATLRRDNGDKEFGLDSDTPFKNNAGEIVFMRFEVY